jgi:hypothetical protein
MKIEHAFWLEGSTQAVWAVELRDDEVAACWGPLLADEVDEDLLDVFDYGPGGAAWIELNRDRFSTLRPAVPDLPEM